MREGTDTIGMESPYKNAGRIGNTETGLTEIEQKKEKLDLKLVISMFLTPKIPLIRGTIIA